MKIFQNRTFLTISNLFFFVMFAIFLWTDIVNGSIFWIVVDSIFVVWSAYNMIGLYNTRGAKVDKT